MSHAFAARMFSDAAKAMQEQAGSRHAYSRLDEEMPDSHQSGAMLGERERRFIALRDSFYLGSVSPDGWPYIQHRGGPAGFVRILGAQMLAFADYRGNRQYISAGNWQTNDRVCLFMMDYAQRQRLKLLGRASAIAADADPALTMAIHDAGYAEPERIVLIRIEAFDWNCPKHITPRYTQAQMQTLQTTHQQNEFN